MERVLRIAAAGLVHLSTPTRCESSQSLPCRLNHGHVAAAKLFGIEEVSAVRTSHFSEADTSGILGHHRAVHSAYAVDNISLVEDARAKWLREAVGTSNWKGESDNGLSAASSRGVFSG
jgi:hypothetical protein